MRFMIIVRASRAIIPYLIERWLGLNGDTARRIGPVLSQGGEFAFVLFAVGVIQSIIGEPLVHLIKLAVTLSMAAQSLALLQQRTTVDHLPSLASGGLWRGCMTCPEMLETAGNASKATAEVACGCELRFDRLS